MATICKGLKCIWDLGKPVEKDLSFNKQGLSFASNLTE